MWAHHYLHYLSSLQAKSFNTATLPHNVLLSLSYSWGAEDNNWQQWYYPTFAFLFAPFHLYLKIGVVPTNFTVSKQKLLCFLCWACIFIACVNTRVDLHGIDSSRRLNCVGCSQMFSKFYRRFQCTYCYFLEPSGGGRLETYEVSGYW